MIVSLTSLSFCTRTKNSVPCTDNFVLPMATILYFPDMWESLLQLSTKEDIHVYVYMYMCVYIHIYTYIYVSIYIFLGYWCESPVIGVRTVMRNSSVMTDRWWLKERPRHCHMWESLFLDVHKGRHTRHEKMFNYLLWINKSKGKDKIYMWVSVLWKTTN